MNEKMARAIRKAQKDFWRPLTRKQRKDMLRDFPSHRDRRYLREHIETIALEYTAR